MLRRKCRVAKWVICLCVPWLSWAKMLSDVMGDMLMGHMAVMGGMLSDVMDHMLLGVMAIMGDMLMGVMAIRGIC